VFDEKKLGPVKILSLLFGHLRTLSPDIVHTHRQKENILGAIAARFSGSMASLRTVHGAPESRPTLFQLHKHLFRLADWLVGRFLQDHIVAVSAQLAELLSAKFPRPKIRVIENGIDIEEIRRAASERVDIPGPKNAIKIAFVGRLVQVKRVDIFLRIAKLLSDNRLRNYTFYVFGDGPLHNEVASLITTLGLDRKVFLMGFRTNIPAYLSKLDFLMITSTHEGLPMNLLEALALQIPVVAHAVGGIPAALKFGACGTLIKDNAPESYVTAISQALENADALAAKTTDGYQWLLDRYSIGRTSTLYRGLYVEMLSRRTSRQ
jgi:glycosyltransferase involved in cell wall biosynthesis